MGFFTSLRAKRAPVEASVEATMTMSKAERKANAEARRHALQTIENFILHASDPKVAAAVQKAQDKLAQKS